MDGDSLESDDGFDDSNREEGYDIVPLENLHLLHQLAANENENSSGESDFMEDLEDIHTFDTDLPSQHSYLGEDLEVLRGRTLLEDGSKHDLDILYHTYVVLVPGQTLPLTVFDPTTINMFQRCISKDHTFGVLCRSIENVNTTLIGTTAEIYEYQNEVVQEARFRIKAKGRQRFKVLNTHVNNSMTATVEILPEVRLNNSLDEIRIQSINRYRRTHSLRCRKKDAMLTHWPLWVYEQYDVKQLINKIKNRLNFLEEESQAVRFKINVPDDPTELSFWIAYNLPIKEHDVKFLLTLNSPIQRLRVELSLLQKMEVLCCKHCRVQIGSHKDVFSMSVEGPQGTYVNPGGYIHETLTLYQVESVIVFGTPSTDFSWFPGYAWSLAKCERCHIHLGWKFTATSNKLMPKQFWGLCRSSLTIELGGFYSMEEENNLVF
uniref:Protein cereblon n=2 Tax=Clastoptera arizonana TaxID=38151 RepID=A0A1B6E425_9HEMI